MSPLALGALLLAAVLVFAFLGIEAYVPSPLVPLRLFRNHNSNGANLASFLVGAAHIPMFYLLALYFQQALGYDALRAGLAILPIGVVSLPLAIVVIPRALSHVGTRGALAGGLVLLAAGLLLLARVPIPSDYVRDILPASLVIAIGLPATLVGTNIAAVTAVGPSETGLASALMNTAQRVGSGIGIAVLTAVFVAQVGPLGQGQPGAANPHANSSTLAAGFHAGFLGAAVFALLGAVVTLVLIRQPATGQVHEVQDGTGSDQAAATAGTRRLPFH